MWHKISDARDLNSFRSTIFQNVPKLPFELYVALPRKWWLKMNTAIHIHTVVIKHLINYIWVSNVVNNSQTTRKKKIKFFGAILSNRWCCCNHITHQEYLTLLHFNEKKVNFMKYKILIINRIIFVIKWNRMLSS